MATPEGVLDTNLPDKVNQPVNYGRRLFSPGTLVPFTNIRLKYC
jgi:hypothetical protein